MRSWTIAEPKGPAGLELVERPIPSPGTGEALVHLRAASLNYRDLQIARGQYPRTPVLLPRLVPLSDGCGEVIRTGPDVTHVRPGDRVVANLAQSWLSGPLTVEHASSTLGAHRHGVLTEYAVFPAESLVPLPSEWSFLAGATLPCAGLTAWNALVVAGKLKPGETVLVQGTGGVSIFAAQLAIEVGARVIATSSSEEKLERMRSMGCAHCINYRTHPDWSAEVMSWTDGHGADLIVEVGGAGTLSRSLSAIGIGGRISLVGTLAGPADIDPRPILGRYASLTGIFAGSCEMLSRFIEFSSARGLSPVIDKVFEFDSAPEAYDWLDSGKHLGKVVIEGA